MALETPAYVISADNHSAALFRQAMQSLLLGTGVVPGGFQVVQRGAGANLSVDVPAGVLWVPGTQGGTQGMNPNRGAQTAYTGPVANFTNQGNYCAYNDGTVNLAISTPDPTNPRIDLVVVTVQDAIYGGSFNQAILQIVTGSPTSAPAAPTVPASSEVIAQIAVAAGATSITNSNITYKASTLQLLPGAGAIVAKSAPYTAVNGDLVFMTGANTVTLPSPKAPGQIVGVWSVNGTGAAPCTISTPSGAITGLGVVAAATSVILGAAGAYMTLQSDGTNWNIVDGIQDSGWIPITGFLNSWSSNAGPGAGVTAAYRKVGNWVHLGGSVTGGTSSGTAGVLPAGYRPLQGLPQFSSTYSNSFNFFTVSPAGVIAPTWAANTTTYLDAAKFTVD